MDMSVVRGKNIKEYMKSMAFGGEGGATKLEKSSGFCIFVWFCSNQYLF